MTRSVDFGTTVSRGVRAAQSTLVVHDLRIHDDVSTSPKIGLVVSKSVGNAVVRHRVSRRLRHVARDVIPDLEPGEQLVIRALPRSASAPSAQLGTELKNALRKARR